MTSTAKATVPTAVVKTPPPDISQLDRVAYLFGYPIAHSLFSSFPRHNLPLPIPQLPATSIRNPNSHRLSRAHQRSQLSPEGAAIGAINTIYHRISPSGEKILCGTNTDCIGIREALLQNATPSTISSIKGSAGMVIGGGGTCRAAVYALKKFLGCEVIYMVNRDKSECDAVIAECSSNGFGDGLLYIESIAQAESLPAPTVIVSAIPDFTPVSADEQRARGIITEFLNKEGEKGAILEMCYHPSPDTQIAALATKAGWQVVGGVESMVYQGLEQDKTWLGVEVEKLPVKEVRRVVLERLESERAKHGKI
ncbi:hypothetical protein EYC84_002140 [Monilinia fructicola]|uniref:Quinate dehydrogenase n=1 Tax=Monilinia fructicola TaxID=38448 RepID=A0A5M9JM33_MONFR|nr:hypothetical protein EYC84_002140 [Monilinia fructicola]